ncbi:MAG: proton-conducting transporter membrane subunit, partial [Candidatus Thorarchaeota archaeon]
IQLFEINPFSSGIYLAISVGIILLEFLTIVETSQNSERSYFAYISLLLLQSSSFFIFSSTSWIVIFFGFILLFAGFNIYFRYLQNTNEDKLTKIVSPYTILNGLSLTLLFFGISSHFIAVNGFEVILETAFLDIWEYLSIILIVTSLLIQLGFPPFHFWSLGFTNDNNMSSSSILTIIQKGISISFMVKIAVNNRDSQIINFLVWLFIIIGFIFALWGVFSSITVSNLKKLIHYISQIHIGFIFLILAFSLSGYLSYPKQLQVMQYLSLNLIGYILLFSFSSIAVSYLSKCYDSENIEDLEGIGKIRIVISIIVSTSFILLFAFPVIMGVLTEVILFEIVSDYLSLISIVYVLVLALSFIYLIRIIKSFFFKTFEKPYLQKTVEPGIHISLILVLFMIILLIVLNVNFLEFCSSMGDSIL